MPDRPRNGGPEDGPEYQWLYGQGGSKEQPPPTRPVRRQPRPDQRAADQRSGGQRAGEQRPDETRVMRTQPRPGAAAGAGGGTRPTPPRPAPPVEPAAPRRRWRPRFRVRYVFVLILLWIAYLVVVPVVAWNRVDKLAWEPDGDRPAEQPGTNYLLVGSDSRAGLTKEQRKELQTGNAAGGRTDTIMVLHTGSGPNLLMSLPRDSLVDIPGYDGERKINAAFAYGGPQLLTQTVEQNTGIRIDQYVEIGMGGVAGIVDAVGGITVCPTQNMKDPLARLNIKKGCQEVDGLTALAYARSRHVAATGDIDRVRRQREVVSAVGSAVASPWTVINPVTYWRLNNALPDFFGFGDGMNPARAGMWAMAMTRVDGEHGLTCVVPLQDLAVHWDAEKAPELFQAIIDDDTASVGDDLCSPTGGIG
jgi:LCP family protein required for cell wall assembly